MKNIAIIEIKLYSILMIHDIPTQPNELAEFAQFALNGSDFKPIDHDVDLDSDADSIADIISGSLRQKVGYSAVLGVMVAVTEAYVVTQYPNGDQFNEHRLFVEYGNDEDDMLDYCLDSGVFFLKNNEQSEADELKEKALKALSAVAEDQA